MALSKEPARLMQEPRSVVVLGYVMGLLSTVPLAVAAVLVWLVDTGTASLVLLAGLGWASVILIFLAGVWRGLSFAAPRNAGVAQPLLALWLFLAGCVSALAALFGYVVLAAAVQFLGFGSIAVRDPAAARRAEVPAFFATLRPIQMLIMLASLLVLVVWAIFHMLPPGAM